MKSGPSSSEAEPEPELLDPETETKPKVHELPATTATTTHETITISLPTPPSSAAIRNLQSITDAEIHALAEKFSTLVPEGTFSLAQIQGYMLMKKADPRGAVEDVAQWVEKQMEERKKLEEMKAKKKQKAKERAEAARKRAAEMAAKGKAPSMLDGHGEDSEAPRDRDESESVADEVNETPQGTSKAVVVNGIKTSASATETFESAISEGSRSGDEPAVAL